MSDDQIRLTVTTERLENEKFLQGRYTVISSNTGYFYVYIDIKTIIQSK